MVKDLNKELDGQRNLKRNIIIYLKGKIMGKGRKKSKEIKKEIKRKNLVKVLVSRGMELNDAIIESHRQIRNGSVKVKLKRMKKHYDNAKECKGTRKKM